MNLDDLHDYNGNALYRMNFTVTVAPGSENKRQFGVAALEMKPPTMTGEEIDDLFRDYIRYVNRVANSGLISRNSNNKNTSTKRALAVQENIFNTFSSMGREMGFYRVEEIPYSALSAMLKAKLRIGEPETVSCGNSSDVSCAYIAISQQYKKLPDRMARATASLYQALRYNSSATIYVLGAPWSSMSFQRLIKERFEQCISGNCDEGGAKSMATAKPTTGHGSD